MSTRNKGTQEWKNTVKLSSLAHKLLLRETKKTGKKIYKIVNDLVIITYKKPVNGTA